VYFYAKKNRIGTIRFTLTDGGDSLAKSTPADATLEVEYSKGLAERLVPGKLIERHRGNLERNLVHNTLRKDFDVAVGYAKGLLRPEEMAIAMELGSALPADAVENEDDSAVEKFLTALQSARAFLDCVANEGTHRVMDFHCVLSKETDEKETYETPPSITLFTLRTDSENPAMIDADAHLHACLKDVKALVDHHGRDIPDPYEDVACTKTKALIYGAKDLACGRLIPGCPVGPVMNGEQPRRLTPNWKLATDLLDRGFHLDEFSVWRDCVLMWMTTLICHLRAKRHEGKALQFWLAAGDLGEVLDSGRFELSDPPAEAGLCEAVAVPADQHLAKGARPDPRADASEKINKARERAIRVASKENYVWFDDARYALFWDMTSLGRAPVGLLRPVDGNWEWYLERQEKVARSNWPLLTLAYERANGSGGVQIGRTVIERFAAQTPRAARVQKWISDVEGIALSQEGGLLLSNLVVEIADDPEEGCAVVLAKNDPRNVFMKMAYPMGLWNPMNLESSRRGEIRRFMTMDGATCVWLDQNERPMVDCQFLLHGDEGTIGKWIPLVRTDHDIRLRGAGARRWSAAVAASHRDVALVIVASQDGDVYAFRRGENESLHMDECRAGVDDGEEPSWEPLIGSE